MGMLVPVLSQRGEILEGLGRYQDAVGVFKKLIQVKDSVSGVETRNQLNEMNTLFQVDEIKMEQARAQFRNTLIIIGLILMTGPNCTDLTFEPDIFSVRRIKVAPVVTLIGFITIIVAIAYKPKADKPQDKEE